MKSEGIKADASCNELTEFVEERCSLPKEHSNFDDIHSDIFNTILDSKITEEEVIDTARSMKSSSKARCGMASLIVIKLAMDAVYQYPYL